MAIVISIVLLTVFKSFSSFFFRSVIIMDEEKRFMSIMENRVASFTSQHWPHKEGSSCSPREVKIVELNILKYKL